MAKHLENDMFDPKGKVQWAENGHDGFLTQPEGPNSNMMKVVEQETMQTHI